MTDVKSLDQLSLILGYIVPGIIILYVTAQFLTGRIGPHKEALLSYFTLSIIYLTVMNAGVLLVTGKPDALPDQTRYWLPIFLAGAVVFGVLVGLNASLGAMRWLLGYFGLNLPHALDSAWDWRFSRFPPSLMTITLKDGSRVSGWCGQDSFIGSDPKDRDLYIEQVYDVDEQGNWTRKTPGKGIYIAGGEVRTIEIIPLTGASS
jgi:Family of unknown function (DUF6338)